MCCRDFYSTTFMNDCFKNIRKKFGFGCMRFPKLDGKKDIVQIQKMIACTKYRYFIDICPRKILISN